MEFKNSDKNKINASAGNHCSPKSNKASLDEGVLVQIDDYDPASHTVRVSRLHDNSSFPERTVNEAKAQTKAYDIEDKKVLKADSDPKGPVVEVRRNYSRLSGSNDNGFFSFKEGGNFIKGPVSFISMPNQIRMSALTTLNPLIISGFPSTIVTPIPTCVWSIPSAGIISTLMKDVLKATTMLAATGV